MGTYPDLIGITIKEPSICAAIQPFSTIKIRKMESLTLFLFASTGLIITPGPDIIYVLSRGIADGKRSGLMSAIGVTSGILVHTLAAALEINGLQKKFNIKKCFIQGFLSNVLNPKVALFFVAFLPQFVGEDSMNHGFSMIGLGLIFALMTIIFLSILGLFAGSIGSWLKEKKNIAGKIRIGSGTVLILLGLRLITPQNN